MKEQLESLNAVAINFGEGGMMAVNTYISTVLFMYVRIVHTNSMKKMLQLPKP